MKRFAVALMLALAAFGSAAHAQTLRQLPRSGATLGDSSLTFASDTVSSKATFATRAASIAQFRSALSKFAFDSLVTTKLDIAGATITGAPTWSSTQTMNITGNVTGNVSGTAATVTMAAQPTITSVGTLTSLTLSGAVSGITTLAGTGAVSGFTTANFSSTGTFGSTLTASNGFVVTTGTITLTPSAFAVGSATAVDANSLTLQSANSNYQLRFKNAAGTSLGGIYSTGTGIIVDPASVTFNGASGVSITGAAGLSVTVGTTAVQALTATLGTVTTGLNLTGDFSSALEGSPYVQFRKADGTRRWYIQADADNGLRFWYFDGASFANAIYNTAGGLTLLGGINATTGTFSGAITYGGVTLSNAVTGTGNMVLSAAPTLTGTTTVATLAATNATFSQTGTTAAIALVSGGRLLFDGAAGNDYLAGGTDKITATVGGGSAVEINAVNGFTLLGGSAILPGTDNVFDLGSAAKRWVELYINPAASGVGDTYICLSTAQQVHQGATCASSTRKIKQNIELDTVGVIARILALRPSSFDYQTGFYDGKADLGFIAEEAALVDRRYAQYAKRNEMLSNGQMIRRGDPEAINYMAILADLTRVVQEDHRAILQLQVQVTTLKRNKP